jgi:uncharacterized protein YbaP (TraB family)
MNMPVFRRWLALALALVLLGGCAATAAPARGAPTRPRAAPAQHVLLWRTSTATATVYLLGSIHVARPDLYPLPSVIEGAFAESDTLVLETDLDIVPLLGASLQIAARALLPLRDSIENHLSRDTVDKLHAYLAAHHLSPDAFNRFQPWFVAMSLPALDATQQGYSADDGIDVHFHDLAENKKRILALEPIESQVELLVSLSQSDQEELLREAIDDEGEEEDLDRLFQLWKSGNAEAFAAYSMHDRGSAQTEELYRRFLFSRNENMSKTIEGYLSERGTYFVVVGTAHLVGDGSIVDLLRRHGRRVEQLTRR